MEGLALHLRLHFGDHSFLADICSLAASLKQTAVNVAASLKKTHVCVDCRRGFTQRHGLFQHRQRHANGSCKEKPFTCNKCGKSFAQKNHLTLHERQHMDLTGHVPKKTHSTPGESCMDPRSAGGSSHNVQIDDRSSMLLHQSQNDNRRVQEISTSDETQNSDRKEIESAMSNSMMLQHSLADRIGSLGQDISSSDNTQQTSQTENQKEINRPMANTLMVHQNQSSPVPIALLQTNSTRITQLPSHHHHPHPLSNKQY